VIVLHFDHDGDVVIRMARGRSLILSHGDLINMSSQ